MASANAMAEHNLQTQVPLPSGSFDSYDQFSHHVGARRRLPSDSPPPELNTTKPLSYGPPSVQQRPLEKATHVADGTEHDLVSSRSSSDSVECQPILLQDNEHEDERMLGTNKKPKIHEILHDRPGSLRQRIKALRAQTQIPYPTERLQWARAIRRSQRKLLASDDTWRPASDEGRQIRPVVPATLLEVLSKEADNLEQDGREQLPQRSFAASGQDSRQVPATQQDERGSRSSSSSSSVEIHPTQWSLSPPAQRHLHDVYTGDVQHKAENEASRSSVSSSTETAEVVRTPEKLQASCSTDADLHGQHSDCSPEQEADGVSVDSPRQNQREGNTIDSCGPRSAQASSSATKPASQVQSSSSNNVTEVIAISRPHIQVKQTPYHPSIGTHLVQTSVSSRDPETTIVCATYPESDSTTQRNPLSGQSSVTSSGHDDVPENLQQSSAGNVSTMDRDPGSPARKRTRHTYSDTAYTRLDEQRRTERRLHRQTIPSRQVSRPVFDGSADVLQPVQTPSRRQEDQDPRKLTITFSSNLPVSSNGRSRSSLDITPDELDCNHATNRAGSNEAQQTYNRFTNAYPTYTGSALCFRNSLELLWDLRGQPHEPHPSLWDDFVFRYAHEYLYTYLDLCRKQSRQPLAFAEYYYRYVRRSDRREEVLTEGDVQGSANTHLPPARSTSSHSDRPSHASDNGHELSLNEPNESLLTKAEIMHNARDRSSRTTAKHAKNVSVLGSEVTSDALMQNEPQPKAVNKRLEALDHTESRKRRSLPWPKPVAAKDPRRRVSDQPRPARPEGSLANQAQEQLLAPVERHTAMKPSNEASVAQADEDTFVSVSVTDELESAASPVTFAAPRGLPPLSTAPGEKDSVFATFHKNFAKLPSERSAFELVNKTTPINMYDW